MKFIKRLRNDARLQEKVIQVLKLKLNPYAEQRFKDALASNHKTSPDKLLERSLDAALSIESINQLALSYKVNLKNDLRMLAGAIAGQHASTQVMEAEPREGRGYMEPISTGRLLAKGFCRGSDTLIVVTIPDPVVKLVPPITLGQAAKYRMMLQTYLSESVGAVRDGSDHAVHGLDVSVCDSYISDLSSIFTIRGTETS